MMEALYNPWNPVPLGLTAAAALLVLCGIAIRRSRSVAKSRYIGPIAYTAVSAIILILVNINLYSVITSIPSSLQSTAPVPSVPLISCFASFFVAASALYLVVHSLLRIDNIAWGAAAVVWLGITITVFAETVLYYDFVSGWALLASFGWYLTALSLLALVLIVGRQRILEYGQRQFALGQRTPVAEGSSVVEPTPIAARQHQP